MTSLSSFHSNAHHPKVPVPLSRYLKRISLVSVPLSRYLTALHKYYTPCPWIPKLGTFKRSLEHQNPENILCPLPLPPEKHTSYSAARGECKHVCADRQHSSKGIRKGCSVKRGVHNHSLFFDCVSLWDRLFSLARTIWTNPNTFTKKNMRGEQGS